MAREQPGMYPSPPSSKCRHGLQGMPHAVCTRPRKLATRFIRFFSSSFFAAQVAAADEAFAKAEELNPRLDLTVVAQVLFALLRYTSIRCDSSGHSIERMGWVGWGRVGWGGVG